MVVDLKQKRHRRSMGDQRNPAKIIAVGTMSESEIWTGRETEAGRGMVHAPRTRKEIGNLTGQGRGMETMTVAETNTVTENGTERGIEIVTEKEIETERGKTTGIERGRETVTDTDTEKETTATTGSTGDGTDTAAQMIEETLRTFWRGKNTASKRSAKEMAVENESVQEEVGHQTRIAAATTEANHVHLSK